MAKFLALEVAPEMTGQELKRQMSRSGRFWDDEVIVLAISRKTPLSLVGWISREKTVLQPGVVVISFLLDIFVVYVRDVRGC